MSAATLLAELQARQIRLWIEDDSLRYAAPRGALTAALRERIQACRAELLEHLRGLAGSSLAPIRPVPREGPLALSFAQQRLWFLDQLLPGSAFYNVFVALPIRWPLEVPLLQQSLTAIVARHEALRTVFPALDGAPQQQVLPALAVPLPEIELGGLPPAEREAQARRLAAEAARTPFDLARGPLLRCSLLRFGPSDYQLLLCLHHIVADGWSMGLLASELAAFYDAFAAGRAPQLPPLPIQYADYAHWQRARLAGPRLQQLLDYWAQQLRALEALRLPTDRARPAVQSFRGASLPVHFAAGLLQRARAFGRAEGATLFMTLLAAFKALLHRYTGQGDLAVGAPVAGRNRREIEGLIGFFVNSLVLRTRLDGGIGFRALLARVRDVTLEAYAHEDLPFELLVEKLHPERDMSRNPLFQVTFQLFAEARAGASPAAGGEPPAMDQRGTAIIDLMFILTEHTDGLHGRIEYSTDLFDADTVGRLAAHYGQLLEALLAEPDRPIAELPLLGAAEREHLLGVLGRGEACAWPARLVHELVAEQAARSPDAVAVEAADAILSYRELDARASALAARLRAGGAGPGVLVGLHLTRSATLVVAILAVLKSGGAYLPLEPSYPRARLQRILDDARPAVLLEHAAAGPDAPAFDGPRLSLDAPGETFDDAPGDAPSAAPPGSAAPATPGPAAPAYVLYTSGSTGTPKGVVIPHRALCNHMQWMQRRFPLGPGDRVLQRTPFGFDASVWEFFAPLLAGAVLVMHRPGREDPGALLDTLRQRRIGVLQLVPSLLRPLLEDERFAACTSLRRVFCGGEALGAELVARFATLAPQAELCNLYGPTETCIDATFWPARPLAACEAVPIGRPIANVRAYIVDSRDEPVPIGVGGELLIGGAGLAQGYVHETAASAGRFGPDPFVAGERVYRTGDLCRFRADGNIDYLGRLDEQVKLRGYRIELGELAQTLRQHPAVRDAAAALLSRQPGGEPSLVAYVVPAYAAAAASGDALGNLDGERIAQWADVYQTVYAEPPAGRELATAPEADFTGWTSSYTGQSIPADEMREWLAHTVTRILLLRPRRVLEIGCGTGLLLRRLAGQCEAYWGCDFSAPAIRTLEARLEAAGRPAGTELRCRQADDFSELPPGAFDLVILNSVVQYFSSEAYLLRVLEGALGVLAPGGRLFIGDVRSRPLIEALHTDIELGAAPEMTSAARLRERIRQRIADEQELLIDPAFFSEVLPRRFSRLQALRVEPKRGRAENELTRFRYDVSLWTDAGEVRRCLPHWEAWRAGPADAPVEEVLARRLGDERPEQLAVDGLPDRRVQPALAAVQRLAAAEPLQSIGALQRDGLREEQGGAAGVAPEALWALGERCGYDVLLEPAPAGAGRLRALFVRREPADAARAPLALAPRQPAAGAAEAAPRACTNDPLRSLAARRLAPRLRSFVEERLPEYMVPASFVLLEALPLGPNGKLDRLALPPPGIARPAPAETFVAPLSGAERTLAAIWAQVLNVEEIGRHDGFFELGGDSIRSIQVVALARKAGLLISAQQIFQHQSLAELAAVSRPLPAAAAPTPPAGPQEAPSAAESRFAGARLGQAELDKLFRRLDPAAAAAPESALSPAANAPRSP